MEVGKMPEAKEIIDYLINQNAELIAQVESLTDTVNKLNETIRELREQLGKNSSNSSKPPSSDGLKKKPVKKDRSLRKKSGKNPGGQEGHTGSYLSVLSEADVVEKHMHNDCESCPHRAECMAKACVKETRHVIDTVVEVQITAHEKLSVKECLLCGKAKEGEFPASIKSNVQYGDNLTALVVAFNTVGAVSINRTHEILSSVFNIPLSTGTVKNMVTRCAEKVKPTIEMIRQKLSDSYLIHCDETGTRVDGKTNWAHNASNALYTYMTINVKRGYEGIKAANILPEYKGIIIHDCWESYWKFSDVTHGVCCAHLLRELNGVEENHPEQTWATEFKKLLLKMKKAKEKAIAHGKSSLSKSSVWVYKKRYDEILQTAYEENPLPQTEKGKRGKPKKGKVLSLIDRLRKYKGAVCLFLENLSVPFDNNQAERDIRNIKVKTKVSGCFRSMEGATEYLTLMSYVGTARKHGINSFKAIKLAVLGTPESIFQ